MSLQIDLDLIRKYDQPGPRYTSYPTAPHFTEAVTGEDWEHMIRENNRDPGRDLSLYFHIPFCDTLCWFCGCTTTITRDQTRVSTYLQALITELDLMAERLHPGRRVVQMHFGGGTPTILTSGQIRSLGDKIHTAFSFTGDAEIGCEIDPRGLTREHVRALRETGFNRASLGVQDFNPQVQKAVNRINSPELVTEVVDWIREAGFPSLNLDLIYGLPHQTRASFEQTLNQILEYRPDRLAVFNYAHVPWLKPHQKLIRSGDLPGPEEKLSLLKMIIERLTDHGYVYIGMDHFARTDDELAVAQKKGTLQRNFQGYSTRAGADIYALGLSSISQLEEMYAQNVKTLPEYYDLVGLGRLPYEKGIILDAGDQIRRTVIMRLMCDMELDYLRLSARLNIDFRSYFQDCLHRLAPFAEDGLIEYSSGGFKVTGTGRLFIRNIAMVFDHRLKQSETQYSRTV